MVALKTVFGKESFFLPNIYMNVSVSSIYEWSKSDCQRLTFRLIWRPAMLMQLFLFLRSCARESGSQEMSDGQNNRRNS